MKYLMQLSFKGSHYHGWQRQANVPTVQEVLESCLEKMIGQKINLIGCGRTDSGVHGKKYISHFVLNQIFDFDPVNRLNKMLPNDIAIHKIHAIDEEFHAQHHAISRTYEYRFHGNPDPFLADISTLYDLSNFEETHFKKALELISSQSDFKHFCKSPDQYRDTNCRIFNCHFVAYSNESFGVVITSNRFLQSMMRMIVARLLEVGIGKMSFSEFKKHLIHDQPFSTTKKAYPQGLSLVDVVYPKKFNVSS